MSSLAKGANGVGCQEIFEAAKRNELACVTFIMDRLQISDQPSASRIAPKCLKAAAEVSVPPVSSHSLRLSSP